MKLFSTHFGKLLISALLIITVNKSVKAQTTLVAGDVAFSGYICNAGATPDQFSFVLLKNITAGTVIRFTDYGWFNDVNAFSNAPSGILESEIVFTATSALNAGQEITIVGTTVSIVNPAAGSGTAVITVGANFLVGNLSLASNGDQIFAYQVSFAAPVFIAGIHMNVNTFVNPGDPPTTTAAAWDGLVPLAFRTNNTSAIPPGLTTGTNANWFATEQDNVRFLCGAAPIGTVAQARTALNSANTTPANWTANNTNPPGFTLPSGCAYLSGGCSIALSSAAGTNAQTVCISTPITNITYATTSATGATFSGLPAGVTGSWAGNVATITGTPTVGGSFNYTVTLTGGLCTTENATGTITVTALNIISLISSPGTNIQTVNALTPITTINYATTGATGATFSGLPPGVTGSWAANVVTINGSPTTTVGSPFNFTVTLTGGCGVVTATGTITVNSAVCSSTLTSAPGTNAQTVAVSTPITNITYSTTGATGATFSGLPAGVTGAWAANVVTISGSPTAIGTFNYTVTLTGGPCTTETAPGSISVNGPPTTLVAGDIAFSGYKSNDAVPDQFSFVLLKNITAGTVIRFTDYGWHNDVNAFSNAPSGILESEITFTATTGLNAGQEITIVGTTVTIVNPASGSGTAVYSVGAGFLAGNLSLASNGDQIFAYQGTFAVPVFISGIHMNVNTFVNPGDPPTTTAAAWDGLVPVAFRNNNTSAIPPGLTTGTNANWFATEQDNVKFLCGSAPIFTVTEVRAALNSANTTPANWTANNTNPSGFTLPTGCPYLVPPVCSITLSSAAGTNTQTVCINTAITNITYATLVATGATFSGLPAGLTGAWAANVATISGTPTAAGTFNYTVTLTGGGCSNTATGSITVSPLNTVILSSAPGTDAQTVQILTPITNITYTTTGATGATVTGLPPGVTGSWAANVVTILGSPTSGAGSPYTYTVTLTGGCGTVTATGTITVTICAVTLTSAAGTNAQSVCNNTAITNITYATVGATGATFAGLPPGVTGSWLADVITITGTPTAIAVYNYSVTQVGGACNSTVSNGTITVNGTNTVTLSSVAGTDAQTVCINTPIINITYATTVATGATVSGLPAGVTGSWAANVVTISGTPTTTVGSPFSYTVTLTGGCGGPVSTTGTIAVTANNTVTLSSAAGTNAQTVCINTPIINITYATTGATGATVTGLPAGVSGSWAANVVTISGTPTVAGAALTYTVTLTGGCGAITATGTIAVTANNTVTLTSAAGTNTQTVCVNTPITNITYSTTGATGATVTGLPAGVSGSWAANVLTISGTPTTTVGSPFSYTVTLTGGCGTVTASGTITVIVNTITLTSAPATTLQTVLISTPITNITYSTTGATGATFSGLPAGVTGNWAANTVTISGSPSVLGTFNYTITLTGGCGTITANGTINVVACSITRSSAAGTDAQTVCNNTPITNITYATAAATGASFTGLPAGVTGAWAANVAIISGTPTAAGTFGYVVTLTGGGCGAFNATGTITVNPIPDVNQPADQVVCNNIATAAVNFTGSVPGTVFNWTNSTPSIGLAASGSGNIPSFTATNAGTAPVVATVVVTPTYTSGAGGPLTQTFNFTGALQTWTVPAGVTSVDITASGAQGNTNALGVVGGLGGQATGTLAVTPGQVLNINVGGGGITSTTGGFNGGANAGVGASCVTAQGGGGGGASDVRIAPNGLADRVIVAAGGGGSGGNRVATCGRGTGGGGGGGYYGGGGGAGWPSASVTVPLGGTQVAGGGGGTSTFAAINNGFAGVLGLGGNGGEEVGSNQAGSGAASSGGIGGGLTGGNGTYPGNFTGQSGAGGSSYIGGVTAGTTTTGVQTGHGQVSITYIASLTCAGPTKTFTYTVNPTPTAVATPASQTVCSATPITTIAITGNAVAGVVYNWTRDNTATTTGIAASGSGDITGTLTNTTTAPVTVTFTITPTANGCPGTPITATVLVNPTATVNTIANRVRCYGQTIGGSINFTSPTTGGSIVYNWTNTAPSIGIPASGSGNILNTLAINTSNIPVVATITVTPAYTNGGTTCNGTPMVFTITVNPTPNFSNATLFIPGTLTLADPVYNRPEQYLQGGACVLSVDPQYGTAVHYKTHTFTLAAPSNVTISLLNSDGGNVTPIGRGQDLDPFLQLISPAGFVPAAACTNSIAANDDAGFLPNARLSRIITTTPLAAGTYTIVVSTFDNTPGVGSPTDIPLPWNYTLAVHTTSQSVCNGSLTAPINFTTTVPGTVFNWTNNNTSIGLAASGSGSIASFTATNATTSPVTATITVLPTYTNAGTACTGAPILYYITVNPTPTAIATPSSQTVCSANPITTIALTGAVSGTTYNWTRDNAVAVTGIAASGSGDITGTLTNTTTAPVTVTFTITPTANGCPGTAITATVLVNPTPTAVATPSSQTVCSANPITTIALTGAVSGTTYNWTRDNTATATGIAASGSGDITGTLTNTTTAPVTVTFTITPTANGCPGTAITATVLVNPTPTAIATPAAQTICNAVAITPIVLTGAVSGTTYNWTRDNTVAVTGIAASGSGNITGTLTNTTVAPVTVTFTITPTANGCPGAAITATVIVNPTPVVNAVPNQVVCNGALTTPVTFTTPNTGTTVTYNWTNNNASIGLAATGSGNIGAFTAVNTGTTPVVATVTVTPTIGGSAAIPVTFTNAAPIAINGVNGGPATPYPSTIAVSGLPTTGVAVQSIRLNGITHAWSSDVDVLLVGPGGQKFVPMSLVGGSSGFDATATVTISDAGATTMPTSSTPIPSGTYRPTAGGVASWPAPAPVGPYNPSAPAGSSTFASAYNTTTNWNGTWSLYVNDNFPAADNGSIAGGWAITLAPPSVPGCTGTPITYTYTVNPTPTAVATPSSQTICSGTAIAPIVLTGAVAGTTYAWTRDNTVAVTGIAASGSGNISGTLTNTTPLPVTVTFTIIPTANGCPGLPITATVLVNPRPVMTALPAAQTICNGVTITPIVFASTTPGTTYTWTRDNSGSTTAPGGIQASGSGPSITGFMINTTNAPITVTFTITPTFAGCVGVTPVTATVTIQPTPTAVATPATQVSCSGSPIATINLTGLVAGTVYNWTRDNVVAATGIAASGTGNISGTLTTTGTTPVVVTFTITPSINGCNGPSIIATDTIYPTPSVNQPVNQVVCNGGATTAVAFTGTVAGTVFNWTNNTPSIGLAATGTGNIPVFTAVNTTNAPVTATITVTPVVTSTGCVGVARTFTITVNPTANVGVVPNQTLCTGSSTAAITFTGTVAGTTFSWTNNTPSIGLAASGTGNIPSFTAINTTPTAVTATITVTPNTAAGCVGVATTFTITVNGNSVAPTGAAASVTTSCGPTSTTLSVVGGALGTGASWRWYSGSCGGVLVGTGASITIPVNTTTTYFVRAEGTCNTTLCSPGVTVTINTVPTISIAAAPYTALTPLLRTNLTATVSPTAVGNVVEWYYENGPTSIATGLSINNITVDQVGSYRAKITTAQGCTATSNTVEIRDSATGQLFVYPNPNRGQFQIRYYLPENSISVVRKVAIFDSKGALVYNQRLSVQTRWGAMNINLNVAQGGYFIKILDVNENEIIGARVQVLR